MLRALLVIIALLSFSVICTGMEFFQKQEDDLPYIKYKCDLSFEKVMSLMIDTESDVAAEFRHQLETILKVRDGDGMSQLFWECPPVTYETFESAVFEFVVLPTSSLTHPPILMSEVHFADKLTALGATGAVAFTSLGGDATLVAPLPESGAKDRGSMFTELQAFLEHGSDDQRKLWWKTLAETYTEGLKNGAERKLWLSTHGGGVGYLHGRIDTRPKYYHYTPYKEM
jgi:hypothetical protein